MLAQRNSDHPSVHFFIPTTLQVQVGQLSSTFVPKGSVGKFGRQEGFLQCLQSSFFTQSMNVHMRNILYIAYIVLHKKYNST